jgi:hypothetical protein
MAINLSLPTVLTLTAAFLKLTGVVAWSWLLVASPMIADVLLAGVLLTAIAAYAKRNGVTLADVKEYNAIAGKSSRR